MADILIPNTRPSAGGALVQAAGATLACGYILAGFAAAYAADALARTLQGRRLTAPSAAGAG
jgi:hypothetical protein